MGITGSLPLRWSTLVKGGVEMGSTDSQDVDNCSEYPQLVPTIPIPNHSRVSSSVTTATLIGPSPLESLGCRTDSSCIINVDYHSEGSKHVNRIRCSINSGVTCLGLKCSRGSNMSNVSVPAKRHRGPKSGPELTQSSKVNHRSNVLTPSVSISKTIPSKATGADQHPETPETPSQAP
ncbi:hypothetical protein HETIRDRAFT_166001 [Heterobasidion irregulare TC 32-1]|uniref:Uncharacterized protein n=1 Tax=Heterobasidion irregulare (strain TC 32-1) TaxID=747525 RepID=W4KN59_HETIT|nr:uncharacterized protein HETIRDRAFT_166001 [Heterobasidion irregulare TC 32-1]ETW86486.1 hypothetical protein HETIRDRAFT_166001 [Heterobasidion irregulare TC 32-1]